VSVVAVGLVVGRVAWCVVAVCGLFVMAVGGVVCVVVRMDLMFGALIWKMVGHLVAVVVDLYTDLEVVGTNSLVACRSVVETDVELAVLLARDSENDRLARVVIASRVLRLV